MTLLALFSAATVCAVIGWVVVRAVWGVGRHIQERAQRRESSPPSIVTRQPTAEEIIAANRAGVDDPSRDRSE